MTLNLVQAEVGQTMGFCRLSPGLCSLIATNGHRGRARHDRPRKAMVCPTLRQAANSVFAKNPGGVKDNSPWREPWVGPKSWKPRRGERSGHGALSRTCRSGVLTPLRGWHISGPVPQGLRPGLLSSTPSGLRIVAAREKIDG